MRPYLDGHGHGDGRMRDVVFDLEVFHLEVLDVVDFPLELDRGEGLWLAFQLNLERLDVVVVDVGVSKGVDELSSFESLKNKTNNIIVFCKEDRRIE
jgi:hypothetical protein